MADEIGADRTGLRISPGNPLNDIVEDETQALRTALVAAVAPDRPGLPARAARRSDVELLPEVRQAWPTALVVTRAGAVLNQPHPASFYGGDHRGYTDYPTLESLSSRADV